ncbi:Ff.00g126400.m01.CDS01 [Fusarium sp. VM40]|nr:Ff.00g126400.m01.CDS01 [Fusarium sp. VM40]
MSNPTPPASGTKVPDDTLKAPMMSEQIAADNFVCQSRNILDSIINESDLTINEKSKLFDLLQHWCMARPSTPGHAQAVSASLRHAFYELVFENWDSENDFISFPVRAEKKLAQIAVPVGVFTEDLPVTPRKRKLGQEQQLNKDRRAGAPAYLSVHLNAQGFNFETLWRDQHGSIVNSKFVRLAEGLTMEKAIEKAILNWDARERKLVQQYNTDMVIALARRRIREFSRAGTAALPYVPSELEINGRLIKCDLISDGMHEMSQSFLRIVQAVERRQPRAPRNRM